MKKLLSLKLAIFIIYIVLFASCGLLSNTDLVKKHVDDLDPSLTLGDALDKYKYFTKTEWKEFTTERGTEVVEFKGYYYQKDIVVRIQFIINKDQAEDENGNNFRIGFQGYKKLNQKDSESIAYPSNEFSSEMIEDIYKNKEISWFQSLNLLSSFFNALEKKESENSSKKLIELNDFPSDFAEFINNFVTNKDFQLEHIKFPLSNFELEKSAPTKDDWEFLTGDAIFEGSKESDDGNTYIGKFNIEGSDKISYGLGIPESSTIYYMIFEKSIGEWYLVEYEDSDMLDNL